MTKLKAWIEDLLRDTSLCQGYGLAWNPETDGAISKEELRKLHPEADEEEIGYMREHELEWWRGNEKSY